MTSILRTYREAEEVTEDDMRVAELKWSRLTRGYEVISEIESDSVAWDHFSYGLRHPDPLLAGLILKAVRQAYVTRLAFRDLTGEYLAGHDAGGAATCAVTAYFLTRQLYEPRHDG